MCRLLCCILFLLPMASALAQQKEPPPGSATPAEPLGGSTEKATLVLNPLGHVGAIRGLFFTPDGKQLISVGKDRTVQRWDVATGERLKVFRLWFEPATTSLAPNGKTLAIGHSAKQGQRVLLINLDDGRLVWLAVGDNFDGQVTGLAFSADGDQLAAARQGRGWVDGYVLWDGLKEIWQKPADNRKGRQITKLSGWGPGTIPTPRSLAFSPDGKRLAVGCDYHSLEYPVQKRRVEQAFLLDVPVGDAKPTPAVPLSISGHAKSVLAVAWTPNGKQVVTTYANDGPAAVEVWSADGKLQKRLNLGSGRRQGHGLHFLDAERILLTWSNGGEDQSPRGQGQSILTLGDDLKEERTVFFPTTGPFEATTRSAVTRDGKVAALMGGFHQNEILLWDITTGKSLHKDPLGRQVATPRAAGWSKDGRSLGLGVFPESKKPPLFRFALDLKDLQLSKNVDRSDYYFRYRAHDDKSVQMVMTPYLELKRPDRTVRVNYAVNTRPYTLTPARDANWFACADYECLHLGDLSTGKEIFSFLRPWRQDVLDLAASPDGRWLLSVNNSQVAFLYRIADDPAKTDRMPILYLFFSHGDWILWTKEGYYAASPGGERLMGWQVANGPGKLPSFYAAERFRKKLYRPDVIRKVLEMGSVEAALKSLDGAQAKLVDLDKLLPPQGAVQLLEQKGDQVKVRASAIPGDQSQPVVALRLLVDGRPWPDTLKTLKPGDKAEGEWTIKLPPGKHTVTAMARSQDMAGVSSSIEVTFVKKEDLPVLHVLAIGVSKYKQPNLKLDFAAKDAKDLLAAFEEADKGAMFVAVKGKLLADADAKGAAIVQEMSALRKRVKPNDLVVVFFAGHGVKEKDKFYLLPVDTDSSALATTAVSGDSLRKSLGEFPCQVLLMLDACHSSQGVKAFRPAVDDITRNLSDDECGVAVLCSAMAHQQALEKNGNGMFTRALIEGLKRTEKVPYNYYDNRQYIHHLFSFVFDEVKRESGDRQHPFLSLPWIVESFAIRQVLAASR